MKESIMKKAVTMGTCRLLEPFRHVDATIAKSIGQISEFAFRLGKSKRFFQILRAGATQ